MDDATMKQKLTIFDGHAMRDNFDVQSGADLLCHLVVAQLVVRVKTDQWAEADQVVKVIRAWSHDNEITIDWFEGVRFGYLSKQLATMLWILKPLRNMTRLGKLFTSDWEIDYESPIARGIRAVCSASLTR